jgi:hypothetical protein
MARIINVHPGQGELGDRITIDLEYDPTRSGGVPNVIHVVFHDGVDAPAFNVTATDSTNRTITLVVTVPEHAVTGPIEVDVDGQPPIRTVQNFTATRQHVVALSIAQIMPAGPYQRGGGMTIILGNGNRISPQTRVFFPRSDYGPATLPAPAGTVTLLPFPARCTVRPVPQQTADHGRVRVVDGQDAVFSRLLTFQ